LALKNGADSIQVFADLDLLKESAIQWQAEKRLMIGERGGKKIEGFDLGNSPLSVTKKVVKGKKVIVNSMIVPGSGLVKQQAEQEGIDKILIDAGFDWREPGCSMCLAMNPDQLKPKERCASTSNRNFEGRQGREGRTHLVSPAVAAATALKGKLSLVEDI